MGWQWLPIMATLPMRMLRTLATHITVPVIQIITATRIITVASAWDSATGAVGVADTIRIAVITVTVVTDTGAEVMDTGAVTDIGAATAMRVVHVAVLRLAAAEDLAADEAVAAHEAAVAGTAN